METVSALLAFCAGNSPVIGEFPAQRPVTRSFDVFFDLPWMNGWVNNHEAGNFRPYRAHYDVTVMPRWVDDPAIDKQKKPIRVAGDFRWSEYNYCGIVYQTMHDYNFCIVYVSHGIVTEISHAHIHWIARVLW